MSAVITIFCNLIQNIHAPSVPDDLNLLIRAETATTRLFSRRESVFDRVSDFQSVAGFISALREHAQRTIWEQTGL